MKANLLGWVATICFGSSYIPQIIHTMKVKKVDDVSVWLWIILFVGYIDGIGYGLLLKQSPLIFGYLWGFGCSSFFLILYYKYKGRK